jgi:hypothetical protein
MKSRGFMSVLLLYKRSKKGAIMAQYSLSDTRFESLPQRKRLAIAITEQMMSAAAYGDFRISRAKYHLACIEMDVAGREYDQACQRLLDEQEATHTPYCGVAYPICGAECRSWSQCNWHR